SAATVNSHLTSGHDAPLRLSMPIELVENPRLLLDPVLDLSALQLEQVRFGSSGASIPRNRIVSVAGSPIVHAYHGSTERAPQFFDHSGRQLSLSDVIDSVISADGMVYFDSKVSFKLAGGLVVGFAIYGPLLAYFSYLTTYATFCAAFGAP